MPQLELTWDIRPTPTPSINSFQLPANGVSSSCRANDRILKCFATKSTTLFTSLQHMSDLYSPLPTKHLLH
ncbi:hypothetical protein ES332_A12G227200v1 [Gossypium tomentosum]|uniref:Uncharacterized protein n=1 Tax=Gossypium tomentosum TaxID=34277 RepID=A0A5D2N076_GOSTO|nr:hypothetical protein ES332_A12G227200v1 [Gossypium tomentosum]